MLNYVTFRANGKRCQIICLSVTLAALFGVQPIFADTNESRIKLARLEMAIERHMQETIQKTVLDPILGNNRAKVAVEAEFDLNTKSLEDARKSLKSAFALGYKKNYKDNPIVTAFGSRLIVNRFYVLIIHEHNISITQCKELRNLIVDVAHKYGLRHEDVSFLATTFEHRTNHGNSRNDFWIYISGLLSGLLLVVFCIYARRYYCAGNHAATQKVEP